MQQLLQQLRLSTFYLGLIHSCMAWPVLPAVFFNTLMTHAPLSTSTTTANDAVRKQLPRAGHLLTWHTRHTGTEWT